MKSTFVSIVVLNVIVGVGLLGNAILCASSHNLDGLLGHFLALMWWGLYFQLLIRHLKLKFDHAVLKRVFELLFNDMVNDKKKLDELKTKVKKNNRL